MLKKEIIQRAFELGFEDIGFTTADAFDTHAEVLEDRKELYAWAEGRGLKLTQGTDPKNIYPGAKAIIVLLENYYKKTFPVSLEAKFGRCYLDDDRVTGGGLKLRIKNFRSFLRDRGIESEVPFNLPHRLAAARAGLGTFGKNCLLYANRAAGRSSFVLPIAVVVNCEFEPDSPTIQMGCPSWCKNACLVACPTGALMGPRKIDPGKCISYLSYFGEGITPAELREPMGMWLYGCDHCQNVCPKNRPYLARELPASEKSAAMAGDFEPGSLLHMDLEYFKAKIWPHMFYMPPKEIWRWKMNAARVMGNSLDTQYIPDLARACKENEDFRVRGMAAWALGRIGGIKARKSLEEILKGCGGSERNEVLQALSKA